MITQKNMPEITREETKINNSKESTRRKPNTARNTKGM